MGNGANSKDPNAIRDRLNAQKAWVTALIAEVQNKKWYGKITVIIERGETVRAIKEESILPPTARKDKNL